MDSDPDLKVYDLVDDTAKNQINYGETTRGGQRFTDLISRVVLPDLRKVLLERLFVQGSLSYIYNLHR